jgi:hypothetical protein
VLTPPIDSVVPDTLITTEQLQVKLSNTKPSFVEPLTGKIDEEGSKNNLGIVLKKLSNGIRVNLISQNGEPQRANVRLYVPGFFLFIFHYYLFISLTSSNYYTIYIHIYF